MLSHVTFTGWDRHTDLDDLTAFLEDCPQDRVEIAVLYSANQDDADRYPQVEKAREILRAAKAAGQRAAVHVCGRAAQEGLQTAEAGVFGTRAQFPEALGRLLHLADRVQINVAEDFWPTHGPVVRTVTGLKLLEKYRQAFDAAHALSRPVIVQTREVAGWPDVEHFAPGADRMVPFLFDRSAGAGVESLAWPKPIPGRLVGYAGGLGPANVAELCSWLAEVPGARWWLDIKSRIREPFDNADTGPGEPQPATFVSIEKCRAVMSACERWFRRAF